MTKNTATTTQGEILDDQENVGQVENPAESKFKDGLKKIGTTVVGGLAALQIGLIGPSSAMAGELPKGYEKDVQAGRELKIDNVEIKKSELLDKVVLIDQNSEKELLDIFNTRFAKKGGPKIVAEYNNLSENDKVKVIDYYKNLNDKHIKCVGAYISLLNNIKIGLIYVSNFDKTGEIGEIPETVKSSYDFLLELDPTANELFTKDFLEMMNVIDKTIGIIISAGITKDMKTIAELDKQGAELDKQGAELDKQGAELDKQGAKYVEIGKKIDEQIKYLNGFLGK